MRLLVEDNPDHEAPSLRAPAQRNSADPSDLTRATSTAPTILRAVRGETSCPRGLR
ncbi:MAG: hypothetical protein ACOYXR_02350 [Nitrospirota bacterium]